MGQEITQLKRRRGARADLQAIEAKRAMCLILHYSCESFYDIKDGHTPRITSIAARNFSTGQTTSFSIHKSAEQNHVEPAAISSRYDELEKLMLDEFFEFIKARPGYQFIHWNMRDINFGFQAIEHRFKVLGGIPYVIEDDRKFDLARALIALYRITYVSHGEHGRLHVLMELNQIKGKDAMTGAQEAEAFEKKEFVKLHRSTLRKVDVMADILERVLDGSLKTQATWTDKHGIHPAALVEVLKENWAWSFFLALAAILSFVLNVKGLF